MKSSVAAMPLPNLGEWPQTVKGARVVGLGAPLLGCGAQMVRELPAQLAKVRGTTFRRSASFVVWKSMVRSSPSKRVDAPP
jgi:hypothetical protein